jgi:tRNA-Thr(GGU) m(6)t(6)A37 methyltransferase TsaA
MLERIRRLFSRGPEAVPALPEVTMSPIGVVRNSVKEPMSSGWEDVVSRIVVLPELADALLGLDTYSHVIVLFWPHRLPTEAMGAQHRLHPLDDPQYPLQGVLATRGQVRFNPILSTVVPLLKMRENVLDVRGLDAVDESPVLDVKPYIPYFDAVADAKVPQWVMERVEEKRRARQAKA